MQWSRSHDQLALTFTFFLCLFFIAFSVGQMMRSAFTHSSYLWVRHTCVKWGQTPPPL